LLSRLEKHAIIKAEDKQLPDGTRIIMFFTHLPPFPFGKRKNAWYPLVLSPSQNKVAEPEVEALLRHVWHAELDFFDKDNPFEDDKPDSPQP
jgi:hypothetical protein